MLAVVWILGLALALPSVRAQEPPVFARGHVFFQTDFESADALRQWAGAATLELGCQSPRALAVTQAQETGSRPAVATIKLPAASMRGHTLSGTAMVKAEKVSAKPNSWNGIKFMAAIEAPGGKTWPQADLDTGTFDWKRATFTARIPNDATAVTLVLGLEAVSGKVWFDNIKIAVRKPPLTVTYQPAAGPPFKGHDLPRLRGTMVSPNATEADLRVLGRDWNANLIRWQLIRHGRPGQPSSLNDYDPWLDGELKKLDAALAHCAKFGLRVVVDLHSPPGGKATVSGYIGSDDRLFTDKACQDKLVEVWQKMARRYKDNAAVWGYDLANEPVETSVADDCDDWQGLAERVARAIYAIDPRHAIIVEGPPWGGPDSLRELAPLPLPNVVYSAHMYVPAAFTHQGVFKPGPPCPYPGQIEGKLWDKARLEAALRPVIDFQKKYNVHIYMGEFSAIRWAPDHSAARYLRDVIEIFEQYGWDWSYHAFREWQGWSVEHGEDKQDTRPAAAPTDRQQLLRDWFKKNQKPPLR